MTDESRFQKALNYIDKANRQDPEKVLLDEETYPSEYLYSLRMTQLLSEFEPDASEALQLAVRCQHIERWVIPRDEYPMTRVGYIKWRNSLKQYHAERASEILDNAGYDEEMVSVVSDLVMKKGLRSNPDAQTLEDVICLVFLKYYLEEFSEKHTDDKIIDILQKTWRKMSQKGHEAALNLDLTPSVEALVHKALA